MMAARFWTRNGWSVYHAVGAAVLAAVGFALTHAAWADIFTTAWQDEEASHIFLVPIIAAWLFWVRRERLRHCVPTNEWIGPLLIAVGWAASLYGYYNAVQALWQGGSVLVVLGCVLSVLGLDVLRRFLPAFAVLAFLVPVPGSIRQEVALPLQQWLAQFTQDFFYVMGMDIERAGAALSINGVPVAIAEACNGLRMVFALVLVSYAFAFATPLRNYVRFLILLLSPLSALVFNIIRIIPTVMLYGWSNEQVFGVSGKLVAETFHDVAGWIMLVLAFLALMSIIRVLRWALIPVTPYTLASD